MSKRTGIFNNTMYDAGDYSVPFQLTQTNGVYKNTLYGDNALLVSKVINSLLISISNGAININGRWAIFENEELAVDGGSAQDRKDRIVVQINLGQEINDFVVYVKKGVPGASPVAPAMQRDNTVYELSLATITVPANATSLNTATLVDDRANTSVCGFVVPYGQAPFYPQGEIPQELWYYTLFPDELTAQQKQDVENNGSLYDKYTNSRLTMQNDYIKNYTYAYQPKRNESGAIVYVVAGENLPEQSHSFVLPSDQVYTYDFPGQVSIGLSDAKRFLKIEFEGYCTIGTWSATDSKMQIINVNNGAVLYESVLFGYQAWKSISWKSDSIVINPLTNFKIKIRLVTDTRSGNLSSVAKVRNIRLYCETSEMRGHGV